MSYEKHLKVLSILYIGSGALILLIGLAVAMVMFGGILLSGDASMPLAPVAITFFIGTFVILMSIPSLLGGWGLLKGKSWARVLVLVLGFLNLLNVPLGLALGIYTIWLLMQDRADEHFGRFGGSSHRPDLPSSDEAVVA